MNNLRMRRAAQIILALVLVCSVADVTQGYSVLTHEAIIDSMWDKDIKPLLLKRFPSASADELREAHAHAYGGAIIQDMGYYPLGSKLFSDLTHYVRSGDFVEALIRDSQDLNEYAFAIGALCHYCADNDGHPIAINTSVPILYPKLRRQYGNRVTYDENPTAHIQTEFGFDVLQVARGHYASEDYHDFIGFKVSKPLLQRAFKDTYGIELTSIFTSLDLALGTYRYSVNKVIPTMTKVAWETKKGDIEKQTPGVTRDKFLYNLSQADYHKEWGTEYKKPGMLAKIVSVLFRIVPKVGPFKGFAIKPSTPETEKLFMQSFDATVDSYRQMLRKVGAGDLQLRNKDLDTGQPASAGEYRLADKAYAQLLDKLASHKFQQVPQDLRANILAFYGDKNARIATKKDHAEWQKTLRELTDLKNAGGIAQPTARK
ncbi:MAG TPA: zinc dependent phospholipase C family protein [Blastocatellia bacterium]|nr:zinc dependent phospholipase C family protein [Blastocatellia bacterium]